MVLSFQNPTELKRWKNECEPLGALGNGGCCWRTGQSGRAQSGQVGLMRRGSEVSSPRSPGRVPLVRRGDGVLRLL